MSPTPSAQILQRVSSLPPLPAAVGRLLRLVNAPEVEFKEIARTISLDQTLTAQLLRLANSAFYGFPQQIRTVQQATVVLGRHSIRNMALSLAIVRLRSHMRSDGPLNPDDFWRHSIAAACGARLLAKHQRSVEPDEAFVAGLLHDIGKIVLVEYDPSRYEELLSIAADGLAPLHKLEQETFGIDHAAVGRALCDYWNIPDELAATVAAHHGYAVDVVSSGDASPHSAAAVSERDGGSDPGGASGNSGANIPSGAAAQAMQELCSGRTIEIVNLADTLCKVSGIGRSGNPHVPHTWFTDSGAFSDLPNRVRCTLEDLPAEVASNERIFFEDAVRSDVENRYVGRRRTVQVTIESPDHAFLVELLLRARGYDVIDALPDDAAPEDVEFVVADDSLRGSDYSAYTKAEVPMADYAMWRLEQLSNDWINMDKLHEWLSESINAHAPAL